MSWSASSCISALSRRRRGCGHPNAPLAVVMPEAIAGHTNCMPVITRRDACRAPPSGSCEGVRFRGSPQCRPHAAHARCGSGRRGRRRGMSGPCATWHRLTLLAQVAPHQLWTTIDVASPPAGRRIRSRSPSGEASYSRCVVPGVRRIGGISDREGEAPCADPSRPAAMLTCTRAIARQGAGRHGRPPACTRPAQPTGHLHGSFPSGLSAAASSRADPVPSFDGRAPTGTTAGRRGKSAVPSSHRVRPSVLARLTNEPDTRLTAIAIAIAIAVGLGLGMVARGGIEGEWADDGVCGGRTRGAVSAVALGNPPLRSRYGGYASA